MRTRLPDTILPGQLDNVSAPCPEWRLMLAVLEDAVAIYRKYAGMGGRKHRKLLRETEEWLFSDDTSWPFSFVNACQTVGVDVTWLRAHLRTTAPLRVQAAETMHRLAS
jgi:hypothetical protein